MELDIELNDVFAGGGFTVNGLDLKNTTGRLIIEGGTFWAVNTANPTLDLGRAISLQNATNISLNNVEIEADGYGVYGRDVENFSLTEATISTSDLSEAQPLAGIDFENLSGEVIMENVLIQTGTENNLRIRNTKGLLFADLQGLTLSQGESTTDTNVLIEGHSDAELLVALIDTEIQGARNRAVECVVSGAAGLNCLLVDTVIEQSDAETTDTRFRQHPLLFRSVAGDDPAEQGFEMNYGVFGTESGSTTLNDSLRGAVAADFVQGAGTVNGVINNLVFGVEGEPISGALFGNAIEVTTSANVSHNLVLNDTKMFGAFNDGALRILGAGPTATTIRNLEFYGDDADLLIQVSDTERNTQGSSAVHCLDIADSKLVTWDSARYLAFSQRSTAAGRIRLPGYNGSPNGEDTASGGTASADLTAYFAGRNVNLLSFNPAIEPSAFAPNVVGLVGSQEACTSPLAAE